MKLVWAAVSNMRRSVRQHCFWIDLEHYGEVEKGPFLYARTKPDLTVVSLCGRSYERLGEDRVDLPEMRPRPHCDRCLSIAKQIERVIYAAVSLEEATRVVIDWCKGPDTFNSTPPLFMAAVLTDTIRDTRNHKSSWHSAIAWPANEHKKAVEW